MVVVVVVVVAVVVVVVVAVDNSSTAAAVVRRGHDLGYGSGAPMVLEPSPEQDPWQILKVACPGNTTSGLNPTVECYQRATNSNNQAQL